MEANHEINLTNLDPEHLRAFEDVIGVPLHRNQRLVIQVTDSPRPAQSLSDWKKVYDELTEEQIESIDRDLNTRANLTRHLP
ncbi:MAG: hypothetical protein JXB10_00860 [Pirellulales bacterium]|nr:hypothetical protein [Pirellulales bacterium]